MANNVAVGVAFSDPNLTTGWGVNGTAVTSTGTELNTVADAIASFTTTATPASGTCGVQFVFKNAAGTAVTGIRGLQAWISDVNGAPVTAITSFAALTNGNVDLVVTGKIYNVQTTAAGLLGITFTGSAATRYMAVRLSNGTILVSGAIVIN